MHAYYPHPTWLFSHVVFLAEHVAFAHLTHQDGLLPSAAVILYFQPFVNISFAFDEK